MDQHSIAVVVPTKNRIETLRDAILSVQNQTYANWELIAADDDSDDSTREYLQNLTTLDRRIVFLPRAAGRPKGASARRNDGLNYTTANFVMFLDSDDLLESNCISVRLDAFRSCSDLDAVFFGVSLFAQIPGDLKRVHACPIGAKETPLDRYFSFHHPWNTGSGLWRREFLIGVGGWDERLIQRQDTDLHFRSLLRGVRFKEFPQLNYYYRIPMGDGISKKDNFQTLENHRYLVEKWAMELKDRGTLEQRYRFILLGDAIKVCKRYALYGKLADAWRHWRRLDSLLHSPLYLRFLSFLYFVMPRFSGAPFFLIKLLAGEKLFRSSGTYTGSISEEEWRAAWEVKNSVNQNQRVVPCNSHKEDGRGF